MFGVRKKEKNAEKEAKKKDSKKGVLLPVIGLKKTAAAATNGAGDGRPAVPPKLHLVEKSEGIEIAKKTSNGEAIHDEEPESLLSFHMFPALKDLPKLSLPALAPVQVNQRTLVLQRNITGDFGFNVRRTQFPDVGGQLRAVVFAEPTEVRNGPPRPSEILAGLLPGDQLVMVNGQNVEQIGREQLLSLIQNSGDQVELTVRAMPELAEVCDRNRSRGGARDGGDSLLLPPVSNSLTGEEMSEEERYWLMHKNGYTMAKMLERKSDGKIRIRINGTEMIVDETDIDKANPSALDRVEDLAKLRYINETSAVHVLRHRYGSSLLYTNTGAQSILCMANENDGQLLSNYQKLVNLFKGCRRQQMPPHIYAFTQHIYRTMQMSGRSQCVMLTGVTGSGKSTQLRNICHYLCEIAGWTKTLTYETLSSALGVMEAFGNCSSTLSRNGSRFVNMLTLSFDTAAALKCARIQTFLLDSGHVVKKEKNTTNYHIIYYLLEGADDELARRLHLDEIDQPFRSQLTADDKQAAIMGWQRLQEALKVLGIDEAHRDAIARLLAAVCHLKCAQSTPNLIASKSNFIKYSNANYASNMLNINLEQLSTAIFRSSFAKNPASAPTGSGTSGGVMNRYSMSNGQRSGQEALDSFVTILYNELFIALISLINRSLCASNLITTTNNSITIIDYPGGNFNTAWMEDYQGPSDLVDLTYNYLNERIAELFYDANFNEPIDLYKREQIEVDIELPSQCPHQMTRLIDQKQQLLNCVDIEMRSEERRGLLCILDEEALFPGATDDSLFERIFVHLDDTRLIKRGTHMREFVLGHCMGNSPVIYRVSGWVKTAQPANTEASVLNLLHSSGDPIIGELFSPFGITQSESSTLKMRKATQTIKLDPSGIRPAAGYFSNISAQMDYVISFARRAGTIHFVHCIQPQLPSNRAHSNRANQQINEMMLDVPFVRAQLRSLLIVDAARASSRGYPERLTFKDFRRRFQCLIKEDTSLNDVLDDRAAVGRILERTRVFAHMYRLGLSQVLLRSDVMDELESERELCLKDIIVSLQRECRKYLSKKWLFKRRVFEMAIKCIQRNGRSYLRVREWSWWRLYTRIAPLLSVKRSDDEYREYERRIRTLEEANSELKSAKSRLECRVDELEQMLANERNSAQQLSDALERESDLRLQSQKQLILQQRHNDEPRLSSSSSSYSRLDHSMVLSDAKTNELQKELEALRASELTQRSRAQKTIERLKDIEGELLDMRARNEALESRNAGFDAEVKAVKEECAREKEAHEEVTKERDMASATLQQKTMELQEIRAENQQLQSTVAKLRNELEEGTTAAGGGNQTEEMVVLKKAKRQLEAKCSEQEEELDELAGRVQVLQQTVTRLEMAAERSRNEKTRDLDAKEDEMGELRAQYQRRLRAFEEQLGDMQEANASLMKQNRLLEARVRDNDTQSYSYEESSGHYKRELHKAMALLHDTQIVLAHERENAPSQTVIRQLREQLDDADALKLSILKGKHSLESELSEMRIQLETALAAKKAAELRAMALLKEKNSAVTRADEHDDQLQSALKKYKEAIQENSLLAIQLNDQLERLADVEKDKKKLSDQLNEVTTQLEFEQHNSVEKHRLLLAEQKIRDLEAKLNLELLTKSRLDTLLAKANDEIENLSERFNDMCKSKENEMENAKRSRKEATALGDQLADMKKREHELVHKYKMAAKEAENMEMEKLKVESELKSALQRLQALREAMQNSLEDEEDEDDDEELEDEGDFGGDQMAGDLVGKLAESNGEPK